MSAPACLDASTFCGTADAAVRAAFQAGEEGVWLDPSDFSTMYKD